MSWANRTGHRVAFEEGTAKNQFVRTLYLYGGYSNQDNGTYYDDLWAYRVDNPDEFWRQDFTPDAYLSTGSRESFQYKNNSPAIHYVSPDSDLEYLQRFWVPTNPTSGSGNRYEIRPYLTTDVLRQMNSVGLKTIRDLAGADVYTVLKLRGFDYPNVPDDQRLTVYDICDFRALAIAVVDKCSVTIPSLYDGERNMPWNIKPVFGGAPPKTNNVKWHGRKNYDFLIPQGDDATVLTEQWDGCQFVPQIEGLFGPNINGLGNVQQVQSIRDPHPEIQNLFCRQTPGPRAYHGLVMFEEMLYLLGGQKNTTYFHADAWYRDARLPQTTILKGPVSHTPQPYFFLSSDKPGSYFEYRVWDPYNFVEVRGWTAIVKKGSVSWMNWRKGGPGTGRYQIYFRAVDPAGNRDEKFVMGKNVYNWYYVSPTPWDIIFGVIGAFIGLCIVAYFEYRRRVKKAAMERYAMKRMRRKFKAMQRDIDGKAVDWRTLYMESKQAEEAGMKGKKKNIKKSKDKNAEKREKEKRKREKEKDLIKKKLKAAKEHKDKNKKETSQIDVKIVKKKVETKDIKSSKVAVVDNDEYLDEEKDPKGYPSGQVGTKALEKGMPPKSGKSKVLPGDPSAPSPGELLASKNTELGFKQRKVNKRLKSYEEVEEKDGGDPGGPDDVKDKKNS